MQYITTVADGWPLSVSVSLPIFVSVSLSLSSLSHMHVTLSRSVSVSVSLSLFDCLSFSLSKIQKCTHEHATEHRATVREGLVQRP